jgi:hypothetical protein
MISFIASVVGTSAYSSRRLKKFSMRSKISMSASWLAITSFAACVSSGIRITRKREIQDDNYREKDASTGKDDVRG